jgi:DNA-binding NtrC family response regulator
VERLAQGQINVLILGETGVGKEVIGEAIHRASARRDSPLLKLNCASLSEALLESELFGHERGAFTGACATKPGLIELADRGTVFLDEVGELSPSLQAKLLRLIETRETMRVGGLRSRPVDVRFLFATNRDLEAEVQAGRFRPDLFFRLNGAVVHVPPLRERPSEILPLAEACLARAALQIELGIVPKLSGDAQARLLAHLWPGNVRELRNVIERAVLLSASTTIRADDLALQCAVPAELGGAGSSPTELPAALDASERDRIAQALVACGGNQSRAAESLGIPRRTFVRKLAELGLPRPRRAS